MLVIVLHNLWVQNVPMFVTKLPSVAGGLCIFVRSHIMLLSPDHCHQVIPCPGPNVTSFHLFVCLFDDSRLCGILFLVGYTGLHQLVFCLVGWSNKFGEEKKNCMHSLSLCPCTHFVKRVLLLHLQSLCPVLP
jgi:hypothetical protein